MKVTLVQPPLISEPERPMLTPPLGLLTLGAVLRQENVDVEVIDFNLEGFRNAEYLDQATFYERATDRIASTRPDIVGFTSMALESHVCLKLAGLLKQRDESIVTLFGGPHFGAIALDVLEHYPWTDFVIAGEAEGPIVELIRHLRRADADLANIARRTCGGIEFDRRYRRNVPMDDLPLPDYDLIDLDAYFEANPIRMVCLEQARGCQLRCSFCYSEAHWGHGETAKSPERVVAELRDVAARGARIVFFVGDNFLTSRDRTAAFCEAIEAADLPLVWTCYATLAQLTPPTVVRLARANCRSVFIGVDAVSPHNKKEFRKSYFKGWEQLRSTLELCLSNGIEPTCSFMLSADDTKQGVEETLTAALFSQKLGANICLNALSLYNESAIHRSNREEGMRYGSLKASLVFRTPEVNHENELARSNLGLFPMHQAAPAGPFESDLYQFTHVSSNLLRHVPTTLLRYKLDCGGQLGELFDKITTGMPGRLRAGPGLRAPRGLGQAIAVLRRILGDDSTALEGVLDYELLPRRSAREWNTRLLEVDVAGTVRRCRVNHYQCVRLPFDPSELERLAPVKHDEMVTPYVCTHSYGETIHVEASAALLHFLRADALTSSKLSLDKTAFDFLTRVRILAPARYAEGGAGSDRTLSHA